MAIVRKQKNYRKKPLSDSDDEASTPDPSDPDSGSQDVGETIAELQELRRLRRKPGGIDAEKLLKGSDKPKKQKKTDNDPWKLKTGGLVDKDLVRAGTRDDEESTERKLKLDTFTTQTNALDVDKHMMAYIEEEMRKRRGDHGKKSDEDEAAQRPQGLVDIYEELYRLPDRLQVGQKPVQEGSVQLSTQMLTAIPEVDLGIDVRLKNIEETERAKRRLMDEQDDEKDNANTIQGEEEPNVPANFEKQIQPQDNKARLDKRQKATDEMVAERFKKRMRK